MAVIDADEIRTRFSRALSEMYRAEVPLYGELLRIVAAVNANANDPEQKSHRIAIERHGAIRLGLAAELSLVGRLFRVMGMEPVGYYDLAPAGVPVHSTAFRPTTAASLARNPFRMFTSLLRLELIEDLDLRREAERLLSARQIMTARAVGLIEIAEGEGGLDDASVDEFVREAVDIFRWNAETAVDRATYDRLRVAHPLIADVVCFKGPHVNHLTPRTFDIDTVHASMHSLGMDPKTMIEGPPRRTVPILLRQTSFRARQERVAFAGEGGTHTARFGEVEQRGAALTVKGRALYDRLLASEQPNAFEGFPDDIETLRRDELIFFRYQQGICTPITYEDFLPISAAGIFRSNLSASTEAVISKRSGDRAKFEAALDQPLRSEMSLYADIERRSRDDHTSTING